MAEPTQAKPSKERRSRVRPQHERTVQKELVSVRHGASVNEWAEDRTEGGILGQRAAVRSVSGDALSGAAASAGSRFVHDFSRVPTHTAVLQSRKIVQVSLAVSKPGDQYEQEAERVADAVMQMSDPTIAPFLGEESNPPAISRVQASRQGAGTVSPDLESRIEGMSGGGQALPDVERSFFEQRMGYDLSGVRVHTDANAVQMNRELSAHAFTVGRDIAFNEGAYRPGTGTGRHLLAHELTHVVQQGKAVQFQRRSLQQAPRMVSRLDDKDPEKTVTINVTKLSGSSGSAASAISFGNTKVYHQAKIRLVEGVGKTLNEEKSKAILGDDLILDEFTDSASPTDEEKALFKVNQGTGITMYYVKALSDGNTGEAFIPSQKCDGYAGFVVSNDGSSQTFAHELGHVLLNAGGHDASGENLMDPFIGAKNVKLTEDQIDTMRTSTYAG